MKKILKSNALPLALLGTACIGILATGLFLGMDKKTNFQPEIPVPDTTASEWQEPAASAVPAIQPNLSATDSQDITNKASEHTHIPQKTAAPATEIYPKVTKETDSLVTIEFTPEAEALYPEPPTPPVAEEDTGNPEEPPSYTPEEVKPEPTKAPAQPESPAAGQSNGNGAIYDPVFGWVVPSTVEQSSMDSAGDPDKMVGNM